MNNTEPEVVGAPPPSFLDASLLDAPPIETSANDENIGKAGQYMACLGNVKRAFTKAGVPHLILDFILIKKSIAEDKTMELIAVESVDGGKSLRFVAFPNISAWNSTFQDKIYESVETFKPQGQNFIKFRQRVICKALNAIVTENGKETIAPSRLASAIGQCIVFEIKEAKKQEGSKYTNYNIDATTFHALPIKVDIKSLEDFYARLEEVSEKKESIPDEAPPPPSEPPF